MVEWDPFYLKVYREKIQKNNKQTYKTNNCKTELHLHAEVNCGCDCEVEDSNCQQSSDHPRTDGTERGTSR